MNKLVRLLRQHEPWGALAPPFFLDFQRDFML